MQDKPKRKLLRKRFAIPLVAAGILTAGALSGTLYMFSSPPKMEIPIDLRGKYISNFIYEKDNAFHDYNIALRFLEKIEDKELQKEFDSLLNNESTKVSDDLRMYIKKNKPAIDMIKVGITKNNYTSPEMNSFNELLPNLSGYRALAKTMIADAKIKEIDGDIKGAYDEYFNIIKFAQDSSKGGTLVEGLVGVAMESLALKSMRLSLKKLDSRTLETVIAKLKESEDNFTPLSETLKKENRIMMNTVRYIMKTGNTDFMREGNPDILDGRLAYNLKCNALRVYSFVNKSRINRNLEDYTRESIKFVESPLKENESKEFDEMYTKKDLITRMLLPAVSSVKNVYERFKSNVRGTRLRAAVELYQRQCDKMPDSLQDLVNTGIIEQVPVDPFSNQEFKYLPGENKIYSIGPDFKDDGAKIEYKKVKDQKIKGSLELGDIIF
jgi:hypothetical protein